MNFSEQDLLDVLGDMPKGDPEKAEIFWEGEWAFVSDVQDEVEKELSRK